MPRARRGRGEGGVRLRKDGRYEGTLSSVGEDGRRVRDYVYGATKGEALLALDSYGWPSPRATAAHGRAPMANREQSPTCSGAGCKRTMKDVSEVAIAGHYIFTAPGGGFMRRSNFQRRHYFPMLERAGIPRVPVPSAAEGAGNDARGLGRPSQGDASNLAPRVGNDVAPVLYGLAREHGRGRRSDARQPVSARGRRSVRRSVWRSSPAAWRPYRLATRRKPLRRKA
jgi:hypothetical protein